MCVTSRLFRRPFLEITQPVRAGLTRNKSNNSGESLRQNDREQRSAAFADNKIGKSDVNIELVVQGQGT